MTDPSREYPARSLSGALLWAFLIPALAALVIAGAGAYKLAHEVVARAYDQSLLNLANGVANQVQHRDGELVLSLPAEAEAVLRTDTMDRIFFRVRDDTGRFVAGDRDLPPPEEQASLTQPLFFDAEHLEVPIRGVRLHAASRGAGFYVTVAETLEKRGSAVRTLLGGFGLASIVGLAGIAMVLRYAIPTGLAPLARLEAGIATRDGNDLSPIPPQNVPSELRQLVAALNALLGRVRSNSEAQRHFLQDAAHQLRTPLASLQMQVELLAADPANAEALARLRSAIGRATRLANQLLALARAESAPGQPAGAGSVDLAAYADEMLDEWLAQADRRGVDFGLTRARACCRGDAVLLREVVANLVDNAIKYTQPGGEVTLECGESGGRVHIRVSDNGPGIAPAERERVFERFYRVPGNAVAGSGLGLAIVRETVARHGGTIDIGSGEGGRGCVVQVELPTA